MLIKCILLLSIWIYILKILNIDDIIRIVYELYIYNVYWFGYVIEILWSWFFCIWILDYYLKNFEKFFEDFKIMFIGEKCYENGIDNLEIFLMLEKEDLMNIFGVNFGDSLKCKNV